MVIGFGKSGCKFIYLIKKSPSNIPLPLFFPYILCNWILPMLKNRTTKMFITKLRKILHLKFSASHKFKKRGFVFLLVFHSLIFFFYFFHALIFILSSFLKFYLSFSNFHTLILQSIFDMQNNFLNIYFSVQFIHSEKLQILFL